MKMSAHRERERASLSKYRIAHMHTWKLSIGIFLFFVCLWKARGLRWYRFEWFQRVAMATGCFVNSTQNLQTFTKVWGSCVYIQNKSTKKKLPSKVVDISHQLDRIPRPLTVFQPNIPFSSSSPLLFSFFSFFCIYLFIWTCLSRLWWPVEGQQINVVFSAGYLHACSGGWHSREEA